jgi:hypothetical protein
MEYIILWILALFGLWCLVSKIVESLYTDNSRGEVEVIIKAKNQENTIEYLIKELKKIGMVGKITVLDMESSDRTVDIVHRIEKDDPVVRVIEE